MSTLAIILAVWSVIGVLLSVHGLVALPTDFEICGFSIKLALIIFLLGPIFWVGFIGVLIFYLFDTFSS
jgi:hypothetical protein